MWTHIIIIHTPIRWLYTNVAYLPCRWDVTIAEVSYIYVWFVENFYRWMWGKGCRCLVNKCTQLQILQGSHSFSRPGRADFWVSNKIDLTRDFIIDMGVDKSENLLDPGIIILLSLGLHLSNTLPIKLFHVVEAIWTKLWWERSSLDLGILITELCDLRLNWNKLNNDTGWWFLRILNSSMNVWCT